MIFTRAICAKGSGTKTIRLSKTEAASGLRRTWLILAKGRKDRRQKGSQLSFSFADPIEKFGHIRLPAGGRHLFLDLNIRCFDLRQSNRQEAVFIFRFGAV